MLPGSLPECRVLCFSYPSTVSPNAPDQEAVLDRLARKFLEEIEKIWEVGDRESNEKQPENDSYHRPIIFIGYELGCLIIEKALSIAVEPSGNENTRSLLSLTAAVVFMTV